MLNILSLQSRVAYGHVGNSCAIFALQRLGVAGWPVDTVTLSNHPGHGHATGRFATPSEIRAIIDGVEQCGVFPACNAVLSGYLGDPDNGPVLLDAVARVRRANAAALYCCDPVIGDVGPGAYVRPGIADFFRDQAIPQADIITPNHFEFARITSTASATLSDIKAASTILRSRMAPAGPRLVLITSLQTAETPAGALDCGVCTDAGFFRVRTRLLPTAASGAGDLMTAVFLGEFLQTHDAPASMARAASAVGGVLRVSQEMGGRDLALVAAQQELVAPSILLVPEPC